MNFLTKLLPATLIFLAGCGGGGAPIVNQPTENLTQVTQNSEGYMVQSGLTQKGPLVRGSGVTINELSANTLQPNGKSYAFEVKDDSGKFSPAGINFTSPVLETTALGYYYDENKGVRSTSVVYIRGLSNLATNGDKAVNINVLSSFTKDRIKKLVTTAPTMTFSQARAQAERELLAALFIYNRADIFNGLSANSVTESANFMEMNLGAARPSDQILAAISGLITAMDATGGGINYLINQIETDLADDGLLNNSPGFANPVLQQLLDTSRITNMQTIASNLNAFYKTNYQVANLVQWLDSSGGVDKVIDKYKFFANNVPVASVSKSPAYVTGSEDIGQCFSVGSLTGGSGALYVGSSLASAATTYKVTAKGTNLYMGLTPNAPGTASGFLHRFTPSASTCPAAAPTTNVIRVMKYTVQTPSLVSVNAGNTGTCVNSSTLTCLDMESSGATAIVPFGGLAATFVADPANPVNRAVQLVKDLGAAPWAGVTLGAAGTLKVSPVKMGANKVLTLRVYAPATGVKLMLKLENKASNNTVFVTAEANTTKAGAWETLSFDFDKPTEGTSYNFDTAYDMVSVFPHYGQTVASKATFYIDELKLKTEDRLAGWNLVWFDEFDNAGLPDSTKWGYDTEFNRNGWFNGEQQYYANARTQNTLVSDGTLKIIARKETPPPVGDSGGQQYTSARLITRDKRTWTYGFFEIRAKTPCGLGTWPAIWLLGIPDSQWPKFGEIDIMEQKGFGAADKKEVSGYLHHPGGDPGNLTTLTDACTAFHNYQLTWTPDKIAIAVDNRQYFEYQNPKDGSFGNWPYSGPQYLILNVAMGGALGGAIPANFVSDQMEVDYVRVYQR